MTKEGARRCIVPNIRVRLNFVPDHSSTGPLHCRRVCGSDLPIIIARVQDLARARFGLAFKATDGDAFGVLRVVEIDETICCRAVVSLPYILRG